MENSIEREELEVLARRQDFVEELTEGPLHKRDLVEEMHHSRSTVDRAIEELEDAGFVERASRGYVTTQTGQLVARRYDEFLDAFDSQIQMASVVDAVSHEHDLPLALFEEATVEQIDGPYDLFTRVTDLFGTGERCRVVLPRVYDSRHAKIWHSQVVRGDQTVELFTDEFVLDQLDAEFPELTNELADTDGFDAYEIGTPGFGLVVPSDHSSGDASDDSPPVLLITYDDDEIAGVIETTAPDARVWAREQCSVYRSEGTRVTDQLWSEDVAEELGLVSGAGLSPSLQSEGFELLDEEFFAEREPIPPETGWRAGLGLAEVADGQSVDRSADNGETLCERVSQTLADGGDVAVLGPAGSGKSTLCKQVAHEWTQERDSHVIYRESGQGRPFSSVRILEDHLRDATETVLVVVEDAIRQEASEIFALMHRLAGRDDVVFLLDAREQEWHDSQLDARLDAFRHSGPEVVSMPALDEDDCEELMTTAESLMDATIEIGPADLLAEVREGNPDTGTMVLLIHRLAHLADPLSEHPGTGATALDDDVDSVRQDLEEIGETALDVGLLANTLNAAGVELDSALLHAVGVSGADTQVEPALERLEGYVLLSRPGQSSYRGVPESWSIRFLERYLETTPTERARDQFEHCLQSLFSLAESPDSRRALLSLVNEETQALDRIATARREWADEVARSVFRLGLTNPSVAPLFAPSEDSTLSPPRVCSPETKAECLACRGDMYTKIGDYETAIAEYQRLESLASAETLTEYQVDVQRKRGMVARRQSAYDRAQTHFLDAREQVRRLDAPELESKVLNSLGTAHFFQGAYEQAQEYAEQGLAIARDHDIPQSKVSCLNNLALCCQYQGNLETAIQHYRDGIEIAEEIGYRRGAATNYNNLAGIYNSQLKYQQAKECAEWGLELNRNLGNPKGKADNLESLGITTQQYEGDYERARSYLTRCLEIREKIDYKIGAANALVSLGTIDCRLGELDSAREYSTRALEIAREIEYASTQDTATRQLGRIAFYSGEYEQAKTRYEECLELTEETSDSIALCHAQLGRIALKQGTTGQAETHLESALEALSYVDSVTESVQTLLALCDLERTRGNIQQARSYLDDAADAERVQNNRHLVTRLSEERAHLALAETDLERAQEYAEQALEAFESRDVSLHVGRSYALLGAIAEERDSYADAREYRDNALAAFESVGLPRHALQTLQSLVSICTRLGDDEQATAYRDRASALLDTAPDSVQSQYADWLEETAITE